MSRPPTSWAVAAALAAVAALTIPTWAQVPALASPTGSHDILDAPGLYCCLVYILSARMYPPLSHQTSLTKRTFSDKIIKNFKTATVQHKPSMGSLLGASPSVGAQVTYT